VLQQTAMPNCVYVFAIGVSCFALHCLLSDGLVAFRNSLSGDIDSFRKVDHFVGIPARECWRECGRHMSCAHAVYERRYQLCTLLEGPETPPVPPPGSVVAGKGSGYIVVS